MRRSPRLFLVPLFVVAMLFSAASAQAAPVIGVSQSYRDFGLNLSKGPNYDASRDITKSSSWTGAGMATMRVIVPWDLGARPESNGRRREFQNWLDRVTALGADPYVVLGPTEEATNIVTPGQATRRSNPTGPVAPTPSTYQTAIEKFLKLWGPKGTKGHVRLIGAWNEPNLNEVDMSIPGGVDGKIYLPTSGGGATTTPMTDRGGCSSGATSSNCGPLMAAYYWWVAKMAMGSACTGSGLDCYVVAGEFASAPDAQNYWNTYANKIETIAITLPDIISFHAHRDAEPLGAHRNDSTGVDHDCRPGNEGWCVTANFYKWLKNRGGVWANRSQMRIWNTETGAEYALGNPFGATIQLDQLQRFDNLLSLSDKYRVKRLYYFNFQSAGETDRGLIAQGSNVNTAPRLIWNRITGINCPKGCSGPKAKPAVLEPEEPYAEPPLPEDPEEAPELPPAVSTEAATGIQQTSATLNGMVSPNGKETTYHFDYGMTSAYGAAVPIPDASVGAGTTAVNVTSTVLGLRPSTVYHYRIVATSANGVSVGADLTFKTLPLGSPVVLRNPNTALQWVYYPTTAGTMSMWDWNGTKWTNGSLGGSLSPGSGAAAVRNDNTGEQWLYYPNTSGSISMLNWTGTEWKGGPIGSDVRPGITPAAVRSETSTQQWLYYPNTGGAITVMNWTGTKWTTGSLGSDVMPGSSAAIARSGTSGQQWLYFPNTSGAISMFNWTGSEWTSGSLGSNVEPGTTPAVVRSATSGEQWLYYSNTGGSITMFNWTGTKWTSGGIGSNVMAGTSPSVVRSPTSGQQWVYYTNSSGYVEVLNWTGTEWNAGPIASDVMPGTSPTAVRSSTSGEHWVYYLNTNGSVCMKYWNGSTWSGGVL